MAKKHHPFSHTVIEHHADNSHTVHHIHEKHGHAHSVPARDGDVKLAAGDHDHMLDHMLDNTSEPNHMEDHDGDGKLYEEKKVVPVEEKSGE